MTARQSVRGFLHAGFALLRIRLRIEGLEFRDQGLKITHCCTYGLGVRA